MYRWLLVFILQSIFDYANLGDGTIILTIYFQFFLGDGVGHGQPLSKQPLSAHCQEMQQF